MRSEQALSGAGWQLLFDEQALMGNHQKSILGESEKTSAELLYVFGDLNGDTVKSATFNTDFNCQRVSRKDGHQVFLEITSSKQINLEKVIESLKGFNISGAYTNSPSSPFNAIHLVEKIDTEIHLWSDGNTFTTKPEPSQDLKTGMAVVVGDVKLIDEYKLSFNAYSHNTIRGAAGGVIFLAELALMKSII